MLKALRINSRKLAVSACDLDLKVHYLGNVQTTFTLGDRCTDKPVAALWTNYVKNKTPTPMTLTVCAWGMRVETKQHGVTEYRAHRISFFTAHPAYPGLFVWVYRHEGKRMKVELRCHAALCKTPDVAKMVATQLHDKLSWAFAEFLREKVRRQKSRLVLQKLQQHGSLDLPCPSVTRSKFLLTGQHFKPSVERSNTAPRLLAITEDREGERRMELIGEEEEEGEGTDVVLTRRLANLRLTSTSSDTDLPSPSLLNELLDTNNNPLSEAQQHENRSDETVNTLTLTLRQQETVEHNSITDTDDHTITMTADDGDVMADDDRASMESGFGDVDYHESTSSASSGASSVASHPSAVTDDAYPFPRLAATDYVTPATLLDGPRLDDSDAIGESEVADVLLNEKTASTPLEQTGLVTSRQDSELRNSTNQKQRQAREAIFGRHEVMWSIHL